MYQKAKQSNILVLLLIILNISFSVQCTKETGEPFLVKEISPAFKDYVAFDSSSYWVYKKENASGVFDTVKIYQVWNDRRFHSDITTTGYYYDAIEMFYKSSLTGLTKGEIAVGAPYQNSTMNELYRVYFNNGRYYRILIPKYPFGETQLLGVNEGNFTNVALLNSLMINGRVYSDVYHTHIVDYKEAPDTTFMNYYVAKNYGLVKYSKLQPGKNIDETWVLQDSKLKPIE
ncbi:MAG: hypothetical protein KG029_18250 [Bacteroidetes bacterium]|jgi:hypothetical protein|nr:hypothetical protein [Bacteroidota bacterium]